MSFDEKWKEFLDTGKSQSLWNRAMSFDNNKLVEVIVDFSLNPFGTGQCLST